MNHSGKIRRNHEFSSLKLRNHELREIVKRIMNNEINFFLKHFSGPESGILEFDWLLTRVPPVQFFPIRTGFAKFFTLVTDARH